MKASDLKKFCVTAGSIPPKKLHTGQFRLSENNKFEIYDGTQWVLAANGGTMKSHWDEAESTMLSDSELCEKHPGLAELREELREAREKYEAYRALCQEKRNGSSS